MNGKLRIVAGAMTLALPACLSAQVTGVQFERGLSWQAIQQKAQADGKYIFVEVCATRSPACRRMDDDVFDKDYVASVVADRFVPVKVQTDTTPQDAADVKAWYADAQVIRRDYHVSTYPTFLFFSPRGTLVHRAIGYRDANAFLSLAANARDPAKQLYTLVAVYDAGRSDPAHTRELVRTAFTEGDSATATRIASDYVKHLSESDLYTNDNLRFLSSVTHASTDPGFTVFLSHAARADSVTALPGLSAWVVDGVVLREEINPVIESVGSGGAPDWSKLTSAIAHKYGASHADRTITKAEVTWYRYRADWPRFATTVIRWVERYESAGVMVNNYAWALFERSSDKAVLEKALVWTDRLVHANPTEAVMIDTHANLLYKLGKTNEAVSWEEKAAKLAPEDKSYEQTLAKMKRGEPTWPQGND